MEKTDKGAFRIVGQPDFAIGHDFYTQVSTTIPSYTGYPLGGRIYSLALAFGEDGGEDGSGIEFDGSEVVATVTSVDGASVQRLEAGKDFDVTPGGIATIDFGKYVNGQGANKVLDGGSLTVDAKVRLTDAAAVSAPQGAEFAVSGRDEKFVTASDGDAKGTVSVTGMAPASRRWRAAPAICTARRCRWAGPPCMRPSRRTAGWCGM
ncbi:hypothetical protein BHAP_1156 [Bifidobacterium hapali]|uniref:Uncharacterized protein n=1 Tax=Bifidobacterium hapali TaxID=1630172 RepID=A0A261G072_9BIFI|nr:hypothetical protein BHAP_1156 [Bifidobacterium hapali]